MAINLFANVPACVVAKQSVTFATAGLDIDNIHIIYLVGPVLKSWVPDRAINGISGFEENKGYYVVPKADIDLETYIVPPLEPPFDIETYPGKQIWYDVTDAAARTVTGGEVVELVDKSGNGFDMTQTTIDFPTFTASGGANNLPFMTIEEGGKNMYRNGVALSGGSVAYLVMRYKNFTRTDVPGQGTLKTVLSYATRTNGLIVEDATNGYMPMIDQSGNRNTGLYINTKNTDWQLVVMNTKAAGFPALSAGKEPGSWTCVNTFSAMSPSNIQLGYFSLSANVEIAELLIVDNTLTPVNDLNIRDYFITKYDLSPKNYIVYFGDSLSHGTCTAIMHYYLTSTENDLNLVNYGHGGTIVFPNAGATGVAGRNFSDVYQNPFPFVNTDCWLSFAYGVNDTNQSGINPAWKAGYKSYLQQFIDAGYNPARMIIWKEPTHSTRQSLMAPCFAYIEEIADELGIVLYDANARFLANGGDTLFAEPDTLHPNEAGNRVEADGMNEIIAA